MAEYIDRQEAILSLLDAPTLKGGLLWANDALKRLNDVPIASVAPVSHAHVVVNWLGDCHCSSCGESIDSTSRYCNWCGAILDEPEQKEE